MALAWERSSLISSSAAEALRAETRKVKPWQEANMDQTHRMI